MCQELTGHVVLNVKYADTCIPTCVCTGVHMHVHITISSALCLSLLLFYQYVSIQDIEKDTMTQITASLMNIKHWNRSQLNISMYILYHITRMWIKHKTNHWISLSHSNNRGKTMERDKRKGGGKDFILF